MVLITPLSYFLTPLNTHKIISPHVYVSICLLKLHIITKYITHTAYIIPSIANLFHCCTMPSLMSLFICHHNIYILSLIFPAKLSVFCTIYVPKNSFFLNLTATFTRTNIITITISGYIIFTPKFKPTLYV